MLVLYNRWVMTGSRRSTGPPNLRLYEIHVRSTTSVASVWDSLSTHPRRDPSWPPPLTSLTSFGKQESVDRNQTESPRPNPDSVDFGPISELRLN